MTEIKPDLVFGKGQYMIDTGWLHGEPAVFVALAHKPGPVGEKPPPGEYPTDRILPGELVWTFPTIEQARVVADALCNRLNNTV